MLDGPAERRLAPDNNLGFKPTTFRVNKGSRRVPRRPSFSLKEPILKILVDFVTEDLIPTFCPSCL